jgi:hypothetical protein
MLAYEAILGTLDVFRIQSCLMFKYACKWTVSPIYLSDALLRLKRDGFFDDCLRHRGQFFGP